MIGCWVETNGIPTTNARDTSIEIVRIRCNSPTISCIVHVDLPRRKRFVNDFCSFELVSGSFSFILCIKMQDYYLRKNGKLVLLHVNQWQLVKLQEVFSFQLAAYNQ